MKSKPLFFLFLLTLLSNTRPQAPPTENSDFNLSNLVDSINPFEDSSRDTSLHSFRQQKSEEDSFMPDEPELVNHQSSSSSSETPSSPSEDELFVNSAVTQLNQPKINIDKFIDEVDRIDCSKFNGDKRDPLNVLCDSQLINTAFEPLGRSNTDHHDFFDYLQKVIYQPLAYNADKRVSLSDMVLDSMHLDPKNSFFYGQNVATNYNDFEQSILKLFEGMADKTNNMEDNKEAIGDMIMNTLKRFHLYWNNLRYNNKFDKLKVDTKEILRTLLKSYHSKKEFLNYTSKTLIKNLLQAYFKFVRAHKILNIAKKNGPDLITTQMLTRFQEVAKIIQSGNFNNIWFVKEISHFLNLLQVFHILSTKQGLSQRIVLQNFQTKVMAVFQSEYDHLQHSLLANASPEQTRLFKHFTATLLLKFKHLTFIMFQMNGIGQYVSMPQSNYLTSPFAIKIYYEMLDNMLLIPKTCTEAILLKNCVIQETSKSLKFVVNKYNIKRSTYGWFFLQQLSTMTKKIFEHANEQTWQNWSNFKNYYYSNLFSVMYNYKKLYGVNEMDAISNLETQIGSFLDSGKKKNLTKPINFGILDLLDKDIYNEFLDIKADYNKYAPVEKNKLVLNYLRIRLFKFFENFRKQHVADINSAFIEVIDKLKETIDNWLADLGKQDDDSFASRAFASQELALLNAGDHSQLKSLQNPFNDIKNAPPLEGENDLNEGEDSLNEQDEKSQAQAFETSPLKTKLPSEIPQIFDKFSAMKPSGLPSILPFDTEDNTDSIPTLSLEPTPVLDTPLLEKQPVNKETDLNELPTVSIEEQSNLDGIPTLPIEQPADISSEKGQEGIATLPIEPQQEVENVVQPDLVSLSNEDPLINKEINPNGIETLPVLEADDKEDMSRADLVPLFAKDKPKDSRRVRRLNQRHIKKYFNRKI